MSWEGARRGGEGVTTVGFGEGEEEIKRPQVSSGGTCHNESGRGSLKGLLLEGRFERIVGRTFSETEELKHLKLPWKRETCNDEMV